MPCPLRRAIVRVAIALLLFPYAALAQSPAPDPYWVQDGTAYAKVMWMSDGSWSDDAQQYVSPATKADAIVFFADGHSVSGSNSVSANVFAVGGAGSHAAWASGRANTTYYGFTPGNYLVSFSYTAGKVAMGVTQMNAEIGYETPTQRFSVSGEASGGRIGLDTETDLSDEVGEGSSVHELHHHEEVAGVFAEIEDADDAGVTELREDDGLATEAGAKLGLRGPLGLEELHGDGLTEGHVRAPVDDAHSALAEHGVEAVPPGHDVPEARIGEHVPADRARAPVLERRAAGGAGGAFVAHRRHELRERLPRTSWQTGGEG